MARHSAGGRSAGAGSATLPLFSIYAAAAVTGILRELQLWNTTTTAVALKLVRLTTLGTAGAAITPRKHRRNSAAASCTVNNTHTVAPTLGDDMGYYCILGAAVGAGVIWTFGSEGLETGDVGIANGLGVIVSTGTGQVVDFGLAWDE